MYKLDNVVAGTARVAILGANRGVLHALGYNRVSESHVVGICDLDTNRLHGACQKAGGVQPYTDFSDMLDHAKPDIVHIVTAPNIPRHVWFDHLDSHDCVKLAVFEKPVALVPSELELFSARAASSRFGVVVNHQRRYFPFAIVLRDAIDKYKLGDIYTVYAYACGEVMEMATHMYDLTLMVSGDVMPQSVYGKCSGVKYIDDDHYMCPDNLFVTMGFETGETTFRSTVYVGIDNVADMYDSGIRDALIQSKHHAHYRDRAYFHVVGSRGTLWWREYGTWGYNTDSGCISYPSDYQVDTQLAQHMLSAENVRYVSGAQCDHRCDYVNAVNGIELIFMGYKSHLYNVYYDNIQNRLTDAEYRMLAVKLKEEYGHEQDGRTQVCQ